MANIYLPIEVAKREALPKAFLAAVLASRGHEVVLFEDYIFDKYGYPAPGIYIGKNVFKTEVPYSLEYYHRLKANGVRLLYLDEEGGVYAGKSISEWRKFVVGRAAPETLNSDDTYCAWGHWQAEIYRRESKAAVDVVGSPNFEMCKPRYHDCLREADAEIKGRVQGYILVNTRFNMGNPMRGLGRLFGSGSPANKKLPESWYISQVAQDLKYIGFFVEMMLGLVDRFTGVPVVLRPHPTENMSFYRELFADCPNIIVSGDGHISTWLRDAVMMIHNGCSTAIQAAFAGLPVVTYSPISEGMDMGLPNAIGHRATKLAEVYDLVAEALAGRLPLEVRADIHESIADVDTFEAISRVVDRVATEVQPAGKNSRVSRIALAAGVRARARRLFKPAGVFDYAEFDRTPAYVSAAKKLLNTPLSVQRLNRGMYRVAP